MRETPAAIQAFEEYCALGEERSLRLLAEQQVRRKLGIGTVPEDKWKRAVACRKRTLEKWSAAHDWQNRLKKRLEEEAAHVREKMRHRAYKLCERLAEALEADIDRAIQSGELFANDAAALERIAKLYFQLVGQPLVDRHEQQIDGVVAIVPVFGAEDPLGGGEHHGPDANGLDS